MCVGGSQFKPNLATNGYSQIPLLGHTFSLLQVAPVSTPETHPGSVPFRVSPVSGWQGFPSTSQARTLYGLSHRAHVPYMLKVPVCHLGLVMGLSLPHRKERALMWGLPIFPNPVQGELYQSVF